MYHNLKLLIQFFFKLFNLGLVRHSELLQLRVIEMKQEALEVDFQFAQILNKQSLAKYSQARFGSMSALRQDLFALLVSNFVKDGFFVEFGACDGKFVSNSLLLERDFGWSGILAEPGKIWHEELSKNRKCQIDFRCVWSESGKQIPFSEYEAPGLSSAKSAKNNSDHDVAQRMRKEYLVQTISLDDLLEEHNAPKEINFLSLDTEGSEFEILKNFTFSNYRFKAIASEHNFTNKKSQIFELLTRNGYHQVLSDVSKYDDWYVHKLYLPEFYKQFDITMNALAR